MRIGLIADIHGNYEALRQTLALLEREGAERFWCLGDIVGYGASPNECVTLVAETCEHVLAGNHDLAVVGALDLSSFSYDAEVACRWTSDVIGAEERWFLESLEPTAEVSLEFGGNTRERWVLVHGSPKNPAWEYIFTETEATRMLAVLSARDLAGCFFAHTHVQGAFRGELESGAEFVPPALEPVVALAPEEGLGAQELLLVNPGSVGQPRDQDWRAACALLDTASGQVRFFRVEYDVESACERILEEGLPVFLARRLRLGL